MTLPLRRALAILFAGLFVIVALASVAYGRGYRFDFKARQVRLTGVVFLAGAPSRVQVTVDDGKPRNVSLPTTLRGLLPTTHTVGVAAAGYRGQVFTFNVRSGQTTYAPDLQLYRENPFTTVRTGIPLQALLAPDGSAVAWLEGQNLAIAEATNRKHVVGIPAGADALTWSALSEDVTVLSAERETLATVSKAGIRRSAAYVPPTGEQQKIDQLLNGRMVYSSVQPIPGRTGWLLQDASSAWVLLPNGDFTVASRWGNPIVNAVHLGRQSLATIRREEVLVRNLANDQTALYEIPGITQASAGTHEGELNLLVADGDLLQWERGNLFAP